MSRRELVEVALGRTAPDVVVLGGELVNVHTGELHPADVAIKDGRIAAVGRLEASADERTTVIDAAGRYLVPGLIETHLHHCHSVLGIPQFAGALLEHGITAFADGFYGEAIVGGGDATRFFKEAFERLPIRMLFLVPVLAYVQNRELGLTPARAIDAGEMHEMLDWPGCHGLEEPPPMSVLAGDDVIHSLFEATLERGKVITGHAAALSESEYQAYAAAGASTDHEMVDREESVGKARAGLRLLARQGDPGCEDLSSVIQAFTHDRVDSRAFAFCSDLAGAGKVAVDGTVDHAVRIAISRGVPPVRAIQMATLNAAEALGAQAEIGSIAPGRHADLLLVRTLADLSIESVIVGGRVVAREGAMVESLPEPEYPAEFGSSVGIEGELTAADFDFRVPDDGPDRLEVRAIGVSDEGSLLVSPEVRVEMHPTEGSLRADPDIDVAELAIIDRLDRGTGIGLGFATGFGLRGGAFASTICAVTMNLVIAGVDPEDMAVAANRLTELGGGRVVVDAGRVVAEVALPILGLHSARPTAEVLSALAGADTALASLGCELEDPFSQLEFCFACQDIGEIKLAEEGLMQVRPPRPLEVVVG